jgi:hypothetical protein
MEGESIDWPPFLLYLIYDQLAGGSSPARGAKSSLKCKVQSVIICPLHFSFLIFHLRFFISPRITQINLLILFVEIRDNLLWK